VVNVTGAFGLGVAVVFVDGALRLARYVRQLAAIGSSVRTPPAGPGYRITR
jgi:hypothetical protein